MNLDHSLFSLIQVAPILHEFILQLQNHNIKTVVFEQPKALGRNAI